VAAATDETDATAATPASNKPSHTPWRSPVLNLLALLVQEYKYGRRKRRPRSPS
jgi:hypothetical protein